MMNDIKGKRSAQRLTWSKLVALMIYARTSKTERKRGMFDLVAFLSPFREYIYLQFDVHRLEQHDSAMKAHIEEHRRKKVDEAYDKITDAVQVQTVKGVEKAEKKKAKQEKEKRIKSNRKAEERKKKRKREALQEVSSSEEEPKTKRHKSKAE